MPIKGFVATDEKDSKLPAATKPSDIVISLHEIQKAEEQKLRKAANPIIKPLHILNVSQS